MANRFPLVFDAQQSKSIKELPNGDNLNLAGSSIVDAVNINISGEITASSLTVDTLNVAGVGGSIASVAISNDYNDLNNLPILFSGSYNDLTDVPVGVDWDNITSKPTIPTRLSELENDAGFANEESLNIRADQLIGLAPVAVSNSFTDLIDANQIVTQSQLIGNTITVEVTNTGDLVGSVFGADSTLLVDHFNNAVNADITTSLLVGNDQDLIITTPNKFPIENISIAVAQAGNIFIEGDEITLLGNVIADRLYGTFTGTVYSNDSTVVVNPETGDLNGKLNGEVDGNINKTSDTALSIQSASGITVTPTGDFNMPNATNIELRATNDAVLSATGDLTLQSSSGTIEFNGSQIDASLSDINFANADLNFTGSTLNFLNANVQNFAPSSITQSDTGDFTSNFTTTITQDNQYTKFTKVDVFDDGGGTGGGFVSTINREIKLGDNSLLFDSTVGAGATIGNSSVGGSLLLEAGSGNASEGNADGGDIYITSGYPGVGGDGGKIVLNSNADIFIGPLANTLDIRIGGGPGYAGENNTFFYGNVNIDSGKKLNGDVTGNVTGNLTGSVFADDSTLLVDGVNSKINLQNTVLNNTISTSDENFLINTAATPGERGFTNITTTDSILDIQGAAALPGGQGGGVYINGGIPFDDPSDYTRYGDIIISGRIVSILGGDGEGGGGIAFGGPVIGTTTMDIKGSVFGDDSTLLVDGVNGKIVGDVDTSTITNSSGNLSISSTTISLDAGVIEEKFTEIGDDGSTITIDASSSYNVYNTSANGNITLAFTNVPAQNDDKSYTFKLIVSGAITFTGITINGVAAEDRFKDNVTSTSGNNIGEIIVRLIYIGNSNPYALVDISEYS